MPLGGLHPSIAPTCEPLKSVSATPEISDMQVVDKSTGTVRQLPGLVAMHPSSLLSLAVPHKEDFTWRKMSAERNLTCRYV